MLLVVGEVVRLADSSVLDELSASGLVSNSNMVSDAVSVPLGDQEGLA